MAASPATVVALPAATVVAVSLATVVAFSGGHLTGPRSNPPFTGRRGAPFCHGGAPRRARLGSGSVTVEPRGASGTAKVNVDPAPSVEVTRRSPLMACASWRAM